MKIIFLDIDGVLNRCGIIPEHRTKTRNAHGCIGLEPELVDMLVCMLEQTGAQVVLSSSWRMFDDLVIDIENAGIPIFARTEKLGGERGEEVDRWLCEYLQENPDAQVQYAIIDDETDFYPTQPLFQTNGAEGLTDDLCLEIIAHLRTHA